MPQAEDCGLPPQATPNLEPGCDGMSTASIQEMRCNAPARPNVESTRKTRKFDPSRCRIRPKPASRIYLMCVDSASKTPTGSREKSKVHLMVRELV
jgi:hypothetical protein